MKIYRIRIANFRGFEEFVLAPRDHVFLVGQPGSGRSDLLHALWRVLSSDSTRSPLTEDLDFFKRDLSRWIEIEVVLGDLGMHWQQLFLDRLDLWNPSENSVVDEVMLGSDVDQDAFEFVVRLCYRAVWDADQQQARHWVDFPKYSDPEAEVFRYVPRELRDLPVAFAGTSRAPLSLAARGELRQLIDDQGQGDFAESLDKLMARIAGLAEDLFESEGLSSVLDQLIEPLRIPLNLAERIPSDVVRFAPEGGSIAGLLRGLAPTIKLGEELGFLPLNRHGSTLEGLLRLAYATARSARESTIVLVDDFGEGVDPDAALHMASVLRRDAAQVWLSTRLGSIGQTFRPEEVVRLTVDHQGARRAHRGAIPQSRSERIAARHLHLQLLPAVSSRAVAIVEGAHDRIALSACGTKLNSEAGTPLLAARRITLLDAAAAEGSGGIAAIPRLARLARGLGFFVVAIIDWDRDEEDAKQLLAENLAAADVVMRWPEGYAIERALLEGLDEEVTRAALAEVVVATGVKPEFDLDALTRADLVKQGSKFIKSAGGLHGLFVDALPTGTTPPLIVRCLAGLRASIGKGGLVQL